MSYRTVDFYSHAVYPGGSDPVPEHHGTFETEKKEKEGRKKKEQWQSHEEGPHAPRDPKKIIQDDEGEYIDFEEE
jgi:hypothetical protein